MYGAKALDDILADTDFWNAQGDRVKAAAEPRFLRAFLIGARLGAEQEPVEDPLQAAKQISESEFARIVDIADDFITGFTNEWWQQLSNTTRNALRKAIGDARALGLGPEFVIDRIRPFFSLARLERIAVTETTRLMGQGAQASYRAAGHMFWIWRTVEDPLVDEICNDRAKQSDPRLGGNPFPMGVGFVPAHPNCRCWPVPTKVTVRIPA